MRELKELSRNELPELSGIAQATISAIKNDCVSLGVDRCRDPGRNALDVSSGRTQKAAPHSLRVGLINPEGHMARAEISGISPFFIVKNAAAALDFYRERLGFEVTFQEPSDEPFFGIVRRGQAMIMLKSVGADPLPNHKRQSQARWDAYLSVPDPDGLAAEFASRDVPFSEPLKDTPDGLRGFELVDADGYVLFFGRPR
jgi:catechol 2,3-dioxygenase-like lactoylglutathione lyase family enzyme